MGKPGPTAIPITQKAHPNKKASAPIEGTNVPIGMGSSNKKAETKTEKY